MDKINDKKIKKIEKSNKDSYKKAIDNTIFSLENSEAFSIFKEEFVEQTSLFNIIDFSFSEQLTGLVNFDFFNTKSYIKLLNDSENLIDESSRILKRLNSNIVFIFENLISSLMDAKQKVIFVEEFENDANNHLINLYKHFVEILKHQIGNLFIPRVLKFIIEYLDKTNDLELLSKKLDSLEYEFKNNISDQGSKILNKLLDEIYKKYKLNVKAKQTTSESKKIPFSDFDQDKQIFEANFNDEKTALRILGLDNKASQSDIKKAYKKLAVKYHPDKNKSEFAIEQMKKINNAYNLLKKKFN